MQDELDFLKYFTFIESKQKITQTNEKTVLHMACILMCNTKYNAGLLLTLKLHFSAPAA